MKFEPIQLPYSLNSMIPYISQNTMRHHYYDHYERYIEKTNSLKENTPFAEATLEDIIINSEPGSELCNNASQVLNHEFFFKSLLPMADKEPQPGQLLDNIIKIWGSFMDFAKEFDKAGIEIFGSGYVWLVTNDDHSLIIIKGKDAKNPIKHGLNPILNCDVWEHSYYLDYFNNRKEYLKNFWSIINWKLVEERCNYPSNFKPW